MLCVHAPEEKPPERLLQDVYEWVFKDPASGPAMAYNWATFNYGNFNPFDERGVPWTRAKEEVVRANAHAVEEEIELLLTIPRAAEEDIRQIKCLPDLHSKIACCDLFTVQDFEAHFSAKASNSGGSSLKSLPSANYIREVLKRYGAKEVPGTIQPPGRPTVRVLAIRNQAKWLAIRDGSDGHRVCGEEYLVGHPERKSKLSGGDTLV